MTFLRTHFSRINLKAEKKNIFKQKRLFFSIKLRKTSIRIRVSISDLAILKKLVYNIHKLRPIQKQSFCNIKYIFTSTIINYYIIKTVLHNFGSFHGRQGNFCNSNLWCKYIISPQKNKSLAGRDFFYLIFPCTTVHCTVHSQFC